MVESGVMMHHFEHFGKGNKRIKKINKNFYGRIKKNGFKEKKSTLLPRFVLFENG